MVWYSTERHQQLLGREHLVLRRPPVVGEEGVEASRLELAGYGDGAIALPASVNGAAQREHLVVSVWCK